MSNSVNLAMPYGLPDTDADLLEHYGRLEEESVLERHSGNIVRIISTNGPEWSSLHAVCRCIAEVLPSGRPGPDSTTLSEPAILTKPWLWDFLQMSQHSGGGLLPSKILYRNIDSAALRNDIGREFDANERYSSLSAAERTGLAGQFIAGDVKLLLQSETRIGAGVVVPSGPNSGKRSVDIQFFDYDNTPMDPASVVEIFSLVGGRTVSDHPFSKLFSAAVWPNVSPLEGGVRLKLEGSGFADGTTLSVGGVRLPADEITISPDRNSLYATLPPRSEAGAVDVSVHFEGSERTYPGSITYAAGIIDTMRSVNASLVLHLTELIEMVNSEVTAGTIDDARRAHWIHELERIMSHYNRIITKRSYRGGGSLALPQLDQMINNFNPIAESLVADLLTRLAT